ncbi:MAG: hypothetical protein KF824_11145 [Fimbriimonadaceae bacterium]|nr:MAG: hypothetical protein KF824_11145 [Fimbriimonadaceae bacterium]
MKGKPGYSIKSQKPKIGAWLYALVLVAAACYGLLKVFDYVFVSPQLESVIAEYKAEGLPWVAEDYVPHVDEQENAASDILTAINLASPKTIVELEEEASELFNKDLAEFEKWLQAHGLVLDKVVSATQKPKLLFDRDWGAPNYALFSEHSEMKAAAKLLAKRAELMARRGKLDRAISDLLTIGKLGSLLIQEPTFIAVLSALSAHSITYSSAIRVAEPFKDNPAALAKIQEAVETIDSSFTLDQAMMGEAYTHVALLRNMQGGSLKQVNKSLSDAGKPVPKDYSRDGVPTSMTVRAYMARNLRTHIFMHREIRANRHSVLQATQNIEALMDQKREHHTASENFDVFIFLDMRSPGIALARLESTKQMTLAMLECLQFRATNKRYPSSLDEIKMEVRDPLTGKPVRVAEEQGVFKIYANGKNRIDDGGEASEESKKDDWVVRFPPKQRQVKK